MHDASTRIDLILKAISFYERAVQLDPNFALAWARLSRAHAFAYFCRVDTTALAAMQRNERWRTRRNSSRTLLKPCSPWVITNIGCCVITGLPKPRSSASAKCYQAAATYQWPSALIARREGHWDQSIAYFEQALALDPRNVESLTERGMDSHHASTIPGRAKAL